MKLAKTLQGIGTAKCFTNADVWIRDSSTESCYQLHSHALNSNPKIPCCKLIRDKYLQNVPPQTASKLSTQLCCYYVPMQKLSFGSIQLIQIICLANLSSQVFVSFMHTFTATSLGPHLCCRKAIVNKFCWWSWLHDILDRVMSFATAGPRLWNSLPADVRSASSLTTFRQKQKTHLFPKSYPDVVL